MPPHCPHAGPSSSAPKFPFSGLESTAGTVGGVVQPMPAPRYGNPPDQPLGPRREGEDGPAILAELSYSAAEIEELLR